MPRPRPPAWLKPLILPAYNAAHRRARRLGEHLDALAHGRFERCDCCGRVAPMLLRPSAIPPRLVELWGLPPRVAAALARKESLDCGRCGAKLRARRIARVVLDLYPTDPPSASLADWSTRPEARRLRLAELNRVDGLHESIAAHPRLSFSDFRPGVRPGASADGVRNEDLTRLTYADASFDLLLTSETLEHVPDLDAALAETFRVLAPGGRHVFTAPVLPHVPATYPRARLAPDGSTVHLAPPLSHPGGDTGYPVFTEVGRDLPDLLRPFGFEVSVAFGPITEDDIAQVYVARKPGPPSPAPGASP